MNVHLTTRTTCLAHYSLKVPPRHLSESSGQPSEKETMQAKNHAFELLVVCMCLCVYLLVCLYVYVCVSVYVCLSVCLCVCLHVCVYFQSP